MGVTPVTLGQKGTNESPRNTSTSVTGGVTGVTPPPCYACDVSNSGKDETYSNDMASVTGVTPYSKHEDMSPLGGHPACLPPAASVPLNGTAPPCAHPETRMERMEDGSILTRCLTVATGRSEPQKGGPDG
jgi:hypothetical protein